MGFESRAISARVTKQIATIFSQTCDNYNNNNNDDNNNNIVNKSDQYMIPFKNNEVLMSFMIQIVVFTFSTLYE